MDASDLTSKQDFISKKHGLKAGALSMKLMPNLTDRVAYTVHSRTLDLYTKLGLIVTRIWDVLEFEVRWRDTYYQFLKLYIIHHFSGV